jgi:hypothetical protein
MARIVRPEQTDAAWMTGALREAGVLRGSSVTGFTQRGIGNGLVGTSIRFELTYDSPEPGAPASVVGKFPATDETSLQAGAALRLYLRETSFYRHIAPAVRIRTPRVFVNEFDPATHDFVLLFEDLTPARGGDQLAGCGVEDAAVAMREIAGLHAPLWGRAAVDEWTFLGLPTAETARIAQLVAPVAGLFQDRFDDVLEPEAMDAVIRLVPLADELMFDTPRQRTVMHGDFRLDNVLFDAKDGAWPLATLDWQTIGRGCGTQDASYFLGAGLHEPDRAAHESDLLRLYHEELLAHGVADYPWAQCWRDYRKHSLNGLFMAMFSAISVARTDRGDEMFLTMARRHARQALELSAFELWEP